MSDKFKLFPNIVFLTTDFVRKIPTKNYYINVNRVANVINIIVSKKKFPLINFIVTSLEYKIYKFKPKT